MMVGEHKQKVESKFENLQVSLFGEKSKGN